MCTSRSGRIILCLIPSALAVLLVGIYALHIFPAFSLTIVNVLCIPLALLALTIGFIEAVNSYKACFFASSIVICALASYINVQADGREIASLLNLPMWTVAWLIALLISIVSLLVILIRLFRWTQEDWENAKAISQQLRLDKKEIWAQQWRVKQAHRASMSEQRYTHQSESTEQKYAHKRDVQTAREEHVRARQDTNYRESRTVWSRIHGFASEHLFWIGSLVKILIFPFVVIMFFFIPVGLSTFDGVKSWSTSVQSLVYSLLGYNLAQDPIKAVAYYFILYVLAICVIGGIVSIIGRTFRGRSDERNSIGYTLSVKYGAPAAVLIVAGIMLALILGGTDLFSGITNIWSALFMIIIFILVCLTTVELVRITLVQCLQPDSLLNKLLYLIFVTTLEFLSSFILGVITRFRIRSLITSLFDLVFPEQNKKLQKRIDSIIDKLIFKELDDIADDSASGHQKSNGGFRKFWRKRTWRRRK